MNRWLRETLRRAAARRAELATKKQAVHATGTPCPDCDTGWPEGRMCSTCKGLGAIAMADERPEDHKE